MENTYQEFMEQVTGETWPVCQGCGMYSDYCVCYDEYEDEEVPCQKAGLLELGGAGSTGRGAVRKVPAPTSDKDAA